MSEQAELSNLVLTRRLADGTVEWIPLKVPQHLAVDPGAAYALIDRTDYEAPQALVAERQGDDLVLEVNATQVLVLDGFFAATAAAFYPTPDVAGGAGPFSGSSVTAESPVLAGFPAGEEVVWSAEPSHGNEQAAVAAPAAASNPAGSGGSGLLWGGLAVGGLVLGGLALGGGGGSGGGSGNSGGGTGADTTPPHITSGATAPAIDENSGAGQVVYTATATDASSFTWSLAAGGDASAFSINSATGAVTLTDNPDFETKPSYSFTVVATDAAGNPAQQAVSLSIVNQNDSAPFITSGATAAPIDENSGADQVVYTAAATDQSAVTWSLKDGGDAATFSIDANTGEVTLTADPDYETKAGYSFTVVATDVQSNTSQQAVSLTINNLDEVAPTITSPDTAAIDENIGAGQVVYTVTADDSGDISGGVTYGLKPGGDANALSIDATTGAVTLTGNPDYEAKSSYTFTVVATDAAGNSTQQAVALAVNNLDEVAPKITSGGTATAINENSGAGQVVYTVTSTDNVDTHTGSTTYSLAVGGDAGAFSINPSSGAVTLTGNPNYEAKNHYDFTVVATDAAGNSSQKPVSLGINNLDESAPTITSGATATAISENSGANQLVYKVTSTDDGDIHTGNTTYSLAPGGDGADFTINGSNGNVRLTADPNFETNPSYDFTVVATDAAGNHSQQAVSLAIINVVDETPPTVSNIALTSASGGENNTLNAGDTVQVTVTMSENTLVSGTPNIDLNIGGNTAHATYVSGSGSTSLIFAYTVQPGDNDGNGISIPTNPLHTNGGSLTDPTGNVAVLNHAAVTDNGMYLVDTTAPTLTSSTPADNSTGFAVGANIELTFSETVHAGSGDITISNGSDTRTIGITDTSQVTVSGNHVTINPAADLSIGSAYNVQIGSGALLDQAGNNYAGINNSTALNFRTEADPTVVVFDLVQGSSSDHDGRTFQNGVSYDIYIRVGSNDSNLSTAGGGPGTWGAWSGAENLGTDDRVILVGDGAAVQGPLGAVTQVSVGPTAVAWIPAFGGAAAELQGESLHRAGPVIGGGVMMQTCSIQRCRVRSSVVRAGS